MFLRGKVRFWGVRFLATLAFLASVLGGCVTGGEQSVPAGLHALRATYDVNVRDEGASMDGRMTLVLSGPETIADRDLVLRPAYRFESRVALWPEGRLEGAVDEVPVVHWLDGALLVARVDCVGPTDDVACTPLQGFDWTVQGAPPPFGFAWPDLLRYQVDGAWVDVDTRLGSERGLPDGSLLALGSRLLGSRFAPDLRFLPGPNGLPEQFRLELQTLQGTMSGRLVSVEVGEPLENIEPWPMPIRPALDVAPPRFLPGENDEAFSMGITFAEAYEALLAKSEDARQLAGEACSVHAFVYYGGGSRWSNVLDDVFGDHDAIAFQLEMWSPSRRATFELRYEHQGGLAQAVVSNVTGDDPYGLVEPVGQEAIPSRCPPREIHPALTANDALHAAWRLGLSGVACGVMTHPIWFGQSGSASAVPMGKVMWFRVHPPVTNIGWDHDPPANGAVTYLAYDVEDARLAWIATVVADDLMAIDGGTLEERPLPNEPRDLVGARGYRCVPPVYDEFP